MRIATKIVGGYLILIGIMAALLVYQVRSIHRMQAAVTVLSTLDFRAGLLALQLMRDQDLIDFYARKYFVRGDPDFEQRLKESLDSFNSTLTELRSKGRPPGERDEIERVTSRWKELSGIRIRKGSPWRNGTVLCLRNWKPVSKSCEPRYS
jgi:hypothetical protein